MKIAKLRLEGYLQALSDNGIKAEHIIKGDFTTQTSYELCKKTFAQNKFPKAFVTSNNYSTLGFIKACKESNLSIGKDISIIGIDHIPVLDAIDYPLSCVTRNAVQMGTLAIDMIEDRIADPKINKRISMVGCELRLRGSDDSSPDEIAAIEAGTLTGIVVQDPFGMGYNGVNYAVKALKGETVEKEVVVPTTLVTLKNIKEPAVQALLYPGK